MPRQQPGRHRAAVKALSPKRVRFAMTLASLCGCIALGSPCFAQQDVADIPAEEHRLAGSELRYLVIGATNSQNAPADGYKVLFVLPGGDGGDEFQPFIKRIYKHALSEDYLAIQLVAHQWSPRQRIVWPTKATRITGMKLSTEQFLTSAFHEVKKQTKINKQHVYALGWSSGGPAVYAAALEPDTPLTGAFLAMSVFKPRQLPPLERASGLCFYILHSKEDRLCPYRMARSAHQQLRQHAAAVTLVTYAGGHGWHGNVYGHIRAGISWLDEATAAADHTDARSGQ